MSTHEVFDHTSVQGSVVEVEDLVHVGPGLGVGGVEVLLPTAGPELVDQVTEDRTTESRENRRFERTILFFVFFEIAARAKQKQKLCKGTFIPRNQDISKNTMYLQRVRLIFGGMELWRSGI